MRDKKAIREVKIGEATVRFSPKTHTYRVTEGNSGARVVPSVTTVTRCIDLGKSPALMGWAAGKSVEYLREKLSKYADKPIDQTVLEGLLDEGAKAYRKKTDEASDIGREVHEFLEDAVLEWIDTGSLPDDRGEGVVAQAYRQFRNWVESRNVEPIAAEGIIYHPEVVYCGTFDLLCNLSTPNGDVATAVVDFKTSNRYYDEFKLQLRAYQHAVPFRAGNFIPSRTMCLMLDKEGGPYSEHWDDPGAAEEEWLTFLGARQIYRWGNGR